MSLNESLNKNKDWISDQKGKIRVVSHYDTDGITSASIISSVLRRMGKFFQLRIVDSLDQKVIDFLAKTPEPIMFLDLGSSHLDLVNQLKNPVLILDHHQVTGDPNDNIKVINPLPEKMSASSVCYFYSKEIDDKNKDLAYLAVIGSSGDREKVPEEIFKDSINVEKTRDLRFYGRNIKPVHRMLSDSFDPVIPGIFNNEGASVEFLNAIGISPRKGDDWKNLNDLTDEEKEKLVAGIVIRRKGQENPEDIFGDIYYLNEFKFDSTEVSTVINAFSRIGYPSRAILLCLKNKEEYNNIDSVLSEYRKEIVDNILHTKENKKVTENSVYIFGKNSKIIGTISSLLLEDSKEGIVGFAPKGDKMKVSVRMNKDMGVGKTVSKIASGLNGFGGGHDKVGGAIIPIDRVDDFINEWEKFLNGELDW